MEKAKSSLLFSDRFLPNALGVAECGDFPSVNRLHVVSDGWKKIHLEHTLHTLTVFINIKYWSWFSDAGQNRKLCLCCCASLPVNISTLFTDAGACFKTFFKKKKKITLLLKGIFFLQQVLDQNFTDVKEAGFSLLCTHWSSLCFQMSSFGLPLKKKKPQKHVLAKKCWEFPD